MATDKLDLNKASAKDLAEHASFIGVRRANNIIRYREIHGPYKSFDSLESVPFVGKRNIQLLSEFFYIDRAKLVKK